jgi:hypothetical protein
MESDAEKIPPNKSVLLNMGLRFGFGGAKISQNGQFRSILTHLLDVRPFPMVAPADFY